MWATLLDEGRYLASERTMYRLLEAAHGSVRERRNQLTHPPYAKPELLAERPNELWSWDISKLRGPAKWTCFYLYVILDVFSRYAVGWTVQHRETAEIAKALLGQATEQQQIRPGTLIVHADRGSAMRSKPVAFLLADLGVTKTHSRPYTSTDNPYSEAQFKTLKYRPEFPARFDSIGQSRAFCREFFDWYNHQHRHSGIGLMTPAAIHHGRAQQLHDRRARVLDQAYARTPERFVPRPPRPPALPTAAWINKPTTEEVASQIRTPTVSFDLTGSARPPHRTSKDPWLEPRGPSGREERPLRRGTCYPLLSTVTNVQSCPAGSRTASMVLRSPNARSANWAP